VFLIYGENILEIGNIHFLHTASKKLLSEIMKLPPPSITKKYREKDRKFNYFASIMNNKDKVHVSSLSLKL